MSSKVYKCNEFGRLLTNVFCSARFTVVYNLSKYKKGENSHYLILFSKIQVKINTEIKICNQGSIKIN